MKIETLFTKAEVKAQSSKAQNTVKARVNENILAVEALCYDKSGKLTHSKVNLPKSAIASLRRAKTVEEFKATVRSLQLAKNLTCDAQAKKIGKIKNTNYEGIRKSIATAINKIEYTPSIAQGKARETLAKNSKKTKTKTTSKNSKKKTVKK